MDQNTLQYKANLINQESKIFQNSYHCNTTIEIIVFGVSFDHPYLGLVEVNDLRQNCKSNQELWLTIICTD